MKSTTTVRVTTALASCSAGAFLALLATASPAVADPVDSAAPPAPVVAVPAPPAVNVQAAGTDVAPLPQAPVPADSAPAVDVQAAGSGGTPLPPNGTPHLASPDALPPGSTLVQQDPDSPNVGYLKDLWQAVQNHEISGKEALVMGLAQRGMSTPYPDQAPGPNVPVNPADAPPPPAPGAPAPAPAPATP